MFSTSTKSNFKFLCDECLTKFERNLVETENDKLNTLVNHVSRLETKLNELSNNLNKPEKTRPEEQIKKSIWNDPERLATVKAKPSKSVLVVKKNESNQINALNQDNIQDTVIQNNIPVTRAFTNKNGDTIMECETPEDRDKLRNLISNKSESIEMDTPAEKRLLITIVGLKKEHSKDEIIKMLVLQNGFIKRFTNQNEINEHIKIFAVKPLKNNPSCYQAFASISKTLREGFNHYSNKITIGLATCKVYDRSNIKRCNGCQQLGHYIRDCPNKSIICGKCGEDHSTNDCENENARCINCVRAGMEDTNHHAISHKCPIMLEKQKSLNARLNSRGSQPLPTP